MKTPNVPVGFIVAILGAVFGLLAAFGVPMSADKQHAIENVVYTLAPIVVLASTWLHTTRAKNVDAIMRAKAVQAAADAKAAQAKVDAGAEAQAQTAATAPATTPAPAA